MPNRLALLLALGLAASIGAANATTAAPAAQSLRVAYGDLDLSHAAGVDALYARLRAAAAQVCNPSDTQDLRSQVSFRACTVRALDDAVAAVHEPRLTAMHARARD